MLSLGKNYGKLVESLCTTYGKHSTVGRPQVLTHTLYVYKPTIIHYLYKVYSRHFPQSQPAFSPHINHRFSTVYTEPTITYTIFKNLIKDNNK